MVGRPKKDNPLAKHWIFLDKTEYELVRVRAKELNLSVSAYIRGLVQKDIESGEWKK